MKEKGKKETDKMTKDLGRRRDPVLSCEEVNEVLRFGKGLVNSPKTACVCPLHFDTVTRVLVLFLGVHNSI